MALRQNQIKYLKGLAHHLKPVVIIGAAGLTAAVLKEVRGALKAHELVKIKLPAMERDDRRSLFNQLCQETRSEAIQQIGRMAILYRRAEKPKIQLPA